MAGLSTRGIQSKSTEKPYAPIIRGINTRDDAHAFVRIRNVLPPVFQNSFGRFRRVSVTPFVGVQPPTELKLVSKFFRFRTVKANDAAKPDELAIRFALDGKI